MKTQFLLTKTFSFEAAHKLVNHDGKCARLHGHSFKLTVVVKGDQRQPVYFDLDSEKPVINPKGNMMMDYYDISQIVKPFIESNLDHYYLNDTLATDMPTSEYIAEFLFNYFESEFRNKGVRLVEIRIAETCTSEAIYRINETDIELKPTDRLTTIS